jgi:hypothetical protein
MALENFEENGKQKLTSEYFNMKKSEMKLVKSYQVLTQYLLYSIRHLNKKNAIVSDLAEQQYKYNEVADDIIKKQVNVY